MHEIPLSALVPSGRNPRRNFSASAMAELEQSVAANGIITPILVRPIAGGKFEVIAGERRYRAATKVLPETAAIPALIRDVGDDEADRLAIIENTDRASMTPVEEAEASARVVDRCQGDTAEAARLLGWDERKLRKRLSLMHCSPAVRAALSDGTISLGHAELLAAAPADKQDKALPVVIDKKLSIEDLKQELGRTAKSLAAAIFDKAGCQGCAHNSAVQADLFAHHVGGSVCTNAACYQQKTTLHVDALGEELKGTYQRVTILKIDNKPAYTQLTPAGANGVGAEQAEACKLCQSYGAALSCLPGSEGKVEGPVCFNLKCHGEKVALAHPAPAVTPEATPATSTKDRPASATATPKSEAPAAKASAEKPEQKFNANALRNAVVEYRRQVWDHALMKVALTFPAETVRKLIVLKLVARSSSTDLNKYSESMRAKAGKAGVIIPDTVDATKLLKAASAYVLGGDTQATDRFIGGYLACAAAGESQEVVQALLRASGGKLSEFWKPDAAFFTLLTKSEIEAVGVEIGVAKHMADNWKPLLGKKKAEIEAGITGSGFDFTGKVPSFMEW